MQAAFSLPGLAPDDADSLKFDKYQAYKTLRRLPRKDMPGIPRAVLRELAEQADANGLAARRTSRNKLAAALGFNPKTIQRALQFLQVHGWIGRSPMRGEHGGFEANLYQLAVHRLVIARPGLASTQPRSPQAPPIAPPPPEQPPEALPPIVEDVREAWRAAAHAQHGVALEGKPLDQEDAAKIAATFERLATKWECAPKLPIRRGIAWWMAKNGSVRRGETVGFLVKVKHRFDLLAADVDELEIAVGAELAERARMRQLVDDSTTSTTEPELVQRAGPKSVLKALRGPR